MTNILKILKILKIEHINQSFNSLEIYKLGNK